jgi:GntR family transcriptional regulator / MocR family aminotransferase
MKPPIQVSIDRFENVPLVEQIYRSIRAAIDGGVLAPGARLPSWLDMATQLGVARGTVRAAYEKLSASQLIIASRADGTRVAARPLNAGRAEVPAAGPFPGLHQGVAGGPALFQMGVPAQATFPATLFARLRAQTVRAEAAAAPMYPDPRGEPALRREIAGYLAVARGIECSPSQIIITAGFGSGLGLVLRALGVGARKVWIEEPGFPITRRGLELAGMSLVPVPVDAEGMDIDHGMRRAPDAGLVVVTSGQQAPLGVTLSVERRLRLLDWAKQQGAWVIEDDYLGELQLKGRAAPALASLDRAGRVIHIGSFSKTISPSLRVGFVVVGAELVSRFTEVATCLAPAPGPSVQLAIAAFMREGHYIRHLRRTKRLYAAQRDAVLDCLRGQAASAAGLAILLRLPDGTDDVAIADQSVAAGLAPVPLSVWYTSPSAAKPGLLLGVATAEPGAVERGCERLCRLIERFGGAP